MALQIISEDKVSLLNELHPRDDEECLYDMSSMPEDLRKRLIGHEKLLKRCELNSVGYSTWPELILGASKFNSLSGTGIFPVASFFNHSCDPNVYRYSIGDLLVFRAARDILPGEELCISYIPNEVLAEPTEIREEFIGDRDFSCACRMCMQKAPTQASNIDRLDFKTRAELRMLSREDRIANIREYLNDDIDGSERLLFSDNLELLVMLARDLEISSGEAKEVWEKAFTFAQGKIPAFDLTHAVLAFHAGNINFAENHCLQYLEISKSDFPKIFRYEVE